MNGFIAFACLLIATVSCASLPGEENLRDLSFVKANLKGAENLLATLETQINYEAENNPTFRNEESGKFSLNFKEEIYFKNPLKF